MDSAASLRRLRSTLSFILLFSLAFPLRAQTQDDPTPTPPDAGLALSDGSDASSPAACPPDDSTDPGLSAPAADAKAEKPYWRTNLFGRFFRDQVFLFRTWVPHEVRNPAFSIPFLGTAALAYSAGEDEDGGVDVQYAADFRDATRGQQGAARFLSTLGDTASGVVLISAGYFLGRWSHHDRFAQASSLAGEALLSAGLWSTILKAATARPRPSPTTEGDFGAYAGGPGISPESFPSGHATGAFAVATVFAGVYSDHKWVSWLAYGSAGLIGLSRITLSRHYPTDVIAGALLGNSMGRMVLARRRETEDKKSEFMPLVSPANRQVGLVWDYSW
jgi:membrane-associated phospholipid phosphatase